MNVVRSGGGSYGSHGSYDSYSSRSYGRTASSTTLSEPAQAAVGTAAIGSVAALIAGLIWMGPLALATVLIEAVSTLFGAAGAVPGAATLGWAAAQGAVIGTLYGLVRLAMSGRRKAGIRFAELLSAVPVAALVSAGLAFLGLFGAGNQFFGDGGPGGGPVLAALGALKFLPLAGGSPPPPAAVEDYVALVLFVILLMVAAIVLGLLSGKITGAMIGQMIEGGVQDAVKSAAKDAAKTYLTTEERDRRSAAWHAAQSGAASGAISGAVSVAIGLHLTAVYAAPETLGWPVVLAIDVTSGLIASFVLVVCRMLLAPTATT